MPQSRIASPGDPAGTASALRRCETVAVSAADARLRTVSPSLIRVVVALICASCIAGLIVTSIADETDAALAFGLVGATAAIGLILVSAVAPPGRADTYDEEQAAAVEASVERLVAEGADEAAVRDLAKRAISLGRSSR